MTTFAMFLKLLNLLVEVSVTVSVGTASAFVRVV